MGAYAGPDADFLDDARKLVNEHRGNGNAAEWVVSAMALSDNVEYDWLDKDGVGRRLDDVQRLTILVADLADPPQTAADILRRARECLNNGYLIPASDKGWEAALLIAKTYADAIGYDYRGESQFSRVMQLLEKAESGQREISGLIYAAENVRQTAKYCAMQGDSRYAEVVADDIGAIAKLADFVLGAVSSENRRAV
ncbi:MAG: hypothetical protein J4G13_05080 [Dehalococcoidia bacterium]|nr:hypothetical protein [Dehalococcoidia bacterium]